MGIPYYGHILLWVIENDGSTDDIYISGSDDEEEGEADEDDCDKN